MVVYNSEDAANWACTQSSSWFPAKKNDDVSCDKRTPSSLVILHHTDCRKDYGSRDNGSSEMFCLLPVIHIRSLTGASAGEHMQRIIMFCFCLC